MSVSVAVPELTFPRPPGCDHPPSRGKLRLHCGHPLPRDGGQPPQDAPTRLADHVQAVPLLQGACMGLEGSGDVGE